MKAVRSRHASVTEPAQPAMMPPSVSPNPAAGLRERIAALTPRERGFLAAGALALLVFLAYLLWPSGDDDDVELAEAPPPAAQPAFVPPPMVPPPMPAAPALPQADSGAAAALVLRGVVGGGPRGGAAIIGFPDGSQRVVRVGREFLPGMTLRGIGVNYAIAASGSGLLRMELNRTGAIAVVPASPAVTAPSGLPPRPGPQEALQYRLGLAPQKVNGRIQGFTIRPDANLPMLERAGLRPGDVLVSVNGQAVESEEKVLELPQEIAGAYTAEFEFIRAGKRMKAAMEVNKRPGS
jgi:membrane-associated protease RseP (regulator of RpoE activity)